MTEKRSIWTKLEKIDARQIWGVFLILMIAFVFVPSAPASQIIPNIQRAYDFVEKLQPGNVVVFDIANSYGYFITHIPGAVAILKHALSKKVNLIFFTTYDDAPLIWKFVILPQITDTMQKYGYEYGKNWVELGFIAGREVGIAAFANNAHVMERDARGNLVDDLPMMKTVKNAGDIALWIQAGIWPDWIIRQAWSKYKTPLIMVYHTAAIAAYPVYVQAGQMVSFIHGWEGGAQYEYLIKSPGLASMGLTLVSVAYLVTLFFLFLGNMVLLGRKLSKKEAN